jgi:hypothetical protein
MSFLALRNFAQHRACELAVGNVWLQLLDAVDDRLALVRDDLELVEPQAVR